MGADDMRRERQDETVRMLAGLAKVADRPERIRQLSRHLGIDTLLFFTTDLEVGCRLVAPGFPQTLPDGIAWDSFVKECGRTRRLHATLPFPKPGLTRPVIGLSYESTSVLVLIGPPPVEADLTVIESVLPLLAAALECEHVGKIRDAKLALAHQMAKESTALAAGLDNARRAAQGEIVARKKAEEALRVTRDELARTNAELEARVQERTHRLRETIADLEAFSYSVSHDMRAPLRAMQAYAVVLIEDLGPRLEASERDYLERISRSAQMLDRLIRDVLSYSRLTHEEVKLETVDLNVIVHEAMQNYPELQEPNAEVIVESPLPSGVLGHEVLVAQCVSNVMMNAVKFVGAGVKPQVRVWCEDHESTLKLWIADNGIGVASHNQKRIFGMFQRINPDGAFEGTGIGLTIVKKAIERMGGEIGVISEEGLGSKFWFTFNKPPVSRIEP